jgi:lipid-A-disaccharide synthase-like uncharacterized protein
MIGHAWEWLSTWLSDPENIWFLVGMGGQFLFFSRFLVQWLKSEITGRSVIPMAFWYFSMGGGIVLLAYSIHIVNWVYITGQAAGLVVYSRNLYLIFRERRGAHPQVEIETPKA